MLTVAMQFLKSNLAPYIRIRNLTQYIAPNLIVISCVVMSMPCLSRDIGGNSGDVNPDILLKQAIREINKPSNIEKVNLVFDPQFSDGTTGHSEDNKYTIFGTCSTANPIDLSRAAKILNAAGIRMQHTDGSQGRLANYLKIQIDFEMKNGIGYSFKFEQENYSIPNSVGMFDSTQDGTYFILANKNTQKQIYIWMKYLFSKGECQKTPTSNWIRAIASNLVIFQ